MLEVLMIVTIALPLGLILFFSLKQTFWLFNRKQKILESHEIITKDLMAKDIEVLSIEKPKGDLMKKNPFNKFFQIALPGVFASGEIALFWVVQCKSKECGDFLVWVKVTHSLYAKLKFEYAFNDKRCRLDSRRTVSRRSVHNEI